MTLDVCFLVRFGHRLPPTLDLKESEAFDRYETRIIRTLKVTAIKPLPGHMSIIMIQLLFSEEVRTQSLNIRMFSTISVFQAGFLPSASAENIQVPYREFPPMCEFWNLIEIVGKFCWVEHLKFDDQEPGTYFQRLHRAESPPERLRLC